MGVKTNTNSKLSFRIVIVFYIFSIFDEVFGALEPGYLYMLMVEGDEPPNRGGNALQQLDPSVQQQPNLPLLQQELNAIEEPEEEQVEEYAEEDVEKPLHPCVICLVEEANQVAVFCGHIAT